jgi:hypothetical protein
MKVPGIPCWGCSWGTDRHGAGRIRRRAGALRSPAKMEFRRVLGPRRPGTRAARPFLLASLIDANGYVAAFVAGSAFGALTARGGEKEVYYVEQTCGLASMISWLLFGALAVPDIAADWDWRIGLYAVLSLTVIHILPVAISLLGARMGWSTVFFIGWFGPRGLASIVFALIALEDLRGLPGPIDEIVATISLTVLLSVFLHGLTAQPLAGRYAATQRADLPDSLNLPGPKNLGQPRVRRQPRSALGKWLLDPQIGAAPPRVHVTLVLHLAGCASRFEWRRPGPKPRVRSADPRLRLCDSRRRSSRPRPDQ